MSLDNLDKMTINENEYDDLCLRYGKARVDREIDLELESKEDAFNRYMSNRNKAIREGTLGAMGATKILISEAIPVFSKYLDKWFAKVNSGKCGKRHVMASLINDLTSEEIAFITLRVTLENSMGMISLSNLGSKIGEAIEDEVRYKMVVNSLDKKELGQFQSGLNKRVALQFKRRYVLAKESLLADEKRLAKWNKWSATNRANIGITLAEMLIVSTGIASLEKHLTKAGNVSYNISVDPDIVNYIEHQDTETATLLFTNRPMVIPPKPWTSPFDGGYLINLKRPIQLVRVKSKDCRDIYSEVDMPNVYKAVNAIQATAWRINQRVLEVANALCSWSHIPESLDMPTAEPAEPPMRPAEADDNEEAHKEWKRQMVHYYQEDNARKSKRILVNGLLAIANDYKEDPEIYFPHNLDFRGRVYPLTRLSPQCNDFGKALIEFAHGVPLGTNGHTWLALQGGNTYGLDKKPFEDRIAWVYENAEMIVNIAENPLEDLRWCEADSPWEFLAFCFEWNDYLKTGESYVSHLPIAFDGSCSGLQHFSAMLRDEVGGEAVNLVPDDKVHDIYNIVAEKVKELLKRDLAEGTIDEMVEGEDGTYLKKGTKSMAREWLDLGITRKVTKRPTMTLCYGASKFGFADQILEDTIYPALSKNPIAFSKPSQSARYMAGLIWEALKGVVVKAVEAMDWLQTASGLLAQDKDIHGNNLPTFWVTPAGFPVRQQYKKFSVSRIKTFVTGNIVVKDLSGNEENEVIKEGTSIRSHFNKETNEIDSRKQKQGIAPNYVHSMDASHLMLTVCSCVDNGVESFAMIHDSYGAPAGHGDIMFTTVREVFVNTYSENDVLQDLHDHIENLLSPKKAEKLPTTPKKGNLNLELVKESMYAFS